MELQQLFGTNVRHFRRARHWTLERLASEVGVSRETIGKIERGVSAPLFETVEKIAECLEVAPNELFNAIPSPAGRRGKLLVQLNSRFASLNETQLATILRLLDAYLDS